MKQMLLRASVLALTLAAPLGCKDATLGPSGTGGIDGVVIDFETSEPLAGASITTTPPSDVLVTGADGRFSIGELEVGNYQITARHPDFQQVTVSLAVRANRTATATLLMEQEDPDADAAAMDAEVLSFWNTVQGDSVFAEAEYRVRNTGGVMIDSYDVSFRITTTAGTRFQQEVGDSLGVDQSEIRRFKLYIQDAQATAVDVETIWTDPPLSTDDG